MTVLGRSHPLLKSLRKLARSGRERDLHGQSLAEGPKVLDAALCAGYRPETVFLGEQWAATEEGAGWQKRILTLGLEPCLVKDDTLRAALDARHAPPLAGIVAWSPAEPAPRPDRDRAWLLIACGVQDPGNLGTLWRTAEAAGATALVRTGSGASLRHPRTWRGSIGSCFRLPAWDVETETILDWQKQHGWKLIGAEAHLGTAAHTFDWPGQTALLLGSEAHGIPDALTAALDDRVTIPLQGDVESLSVGAAAAVLGFAVAAKMNRSNA